MKVMFSYEILSDKIPRILPGGPAGYRERLLAKNFESFYSHSGRIFLRTISPYNLPDRPVFLRLSLYRLVAETNWNESDEDTPRLIEELKEAARREGLSVPGDIHQHICIQSMLKSFSDYYHLYVKYLRGGGMDVATALQVIKSLIREYREDSQNLHL